MATTTAIIWGVRNFLSLERARRLLGKFWTPSVILFSSLLCCALWKWVSLWCALWKRFGSVWLRYFWCTVKQICPLVLLQRDFVCVNSPSPLGMAQHPLVGQDLLIIEASRSYSGIHAHSVGLLWTSDQPDTQTSTWQHTVGRTPLYQWSAHTQTST